MSDNGAALGMALRNQRIADQYRRIADENRHVAERNAKLVREWIAYADKLKSRLSAIEPERDALRRKLEEMQARAEALNALQGKLAAELAKVSPSHPLVPEERRSTIIESALQMAHRPQTRK